MAYGDPYRDPEEEEAPPPAAPPPPIGVVPGPGGAPPPDPAAEDASGGGGGGHGGAAPDLGPQFRWPGLPGFVAPTFDRPTMETALAEPGYEFRLGAGRGALERSAAARGVLRSGGTLKDVLEYGQKFGAQEYSNVFNRALQEYDRRYQGAKDAFAPRLAQYNIQAQGEIQRALAQYNAAHRGGGGGGGFSIPPDILGPPPTMPDYAQMLSAPSADVVPYAGATAGLGAEDEDRYRRLY